MTQGLDFPAGAGGIASLGARRSAAATAGTEPLAASPNQDKRRRRNPYIASEPIAKRPLRIFKRTAPLLCRNRSGWAARKASCSCSGSPADAIDVVMAVALDVRQPQQVYEGENPAAPPAPPGW